MSFSKQDKNDEKPDNYICKYNFFTDLLFLSPKHIWLSPQYILKRLMRTGYSFLLRILFSISDKIIIRVSYPFFFIYPNLNSLFSDHCVFSRSELSFFFLLSLFFLSGPLHRTSDRKFTRKFQIYLSFLQFWVYTTSPLSSLFYDSLTAIWCLPYAVTWFYTLTSLFYHLRPTWSSVASPNSICGNVRVGLATSSSINLFYFFTAILSSESGVTKKFNKSVFSINRKTHFWAFFCDLEIYGPHHIAFELIILFNDLE